MNKIIYSGFYGFHNSGDDVFLETTAWATKELMDNYSPTYFGNNLPELVNPYKEYSKPSFKGHDRIIAANELRNAKYFVSAGGSTFSRHKKNSYKEIAEYIKKYLNRNLKTGAIGVSIGPFKTSEDELNVQEYLKKMDFLAVRDKRSFDYVSQLDLPYQPVEAFDLAALLPEVYKQIPLPKNKLSDDKKVIGVSLCPVESITDRNNIQKEVDRNQRIEQLIKQLNSNHDNLLFKFFIINGHKNIGDENVTMQMISNLKLTNYEIVPYQNKVYDIWNKIQECDLMIATRLHAGIMAAYAEVPFILNEYHQKCTDFVNDIGQAEHLKVGDAEYDDQALLNHLKAILNNESPFNLKHKEKTIQLSHQNFNFINK